MRIPFSWLQSFFKKPLDPKKIAALLTQAGLEVEHIETPNVFDEHVVVGKVLSVEKHPHAEKLSVTKVTTGNGQPRTIVCGAPNVAKDQLVVVALPGSRLPGGQHIEVATIRGIESSGMICAEDELGVGEDHGGILVLPADAVPGSHVSSIGLTDTVLEVEVTPNRSDWLSMVGVARELSALMSMPFTLPVAPLVEKAPHIRTKVKARVATGLADQYRVRLCHAITQSSTPLWMWSRLRLAGIRPTGSAVIDITNYVLLEFGQPLHAFDMEKVSGKQLQVRSARSGESLDLLDGKKIRLRSRDIVIADRKNVIALAGVMGGKSTSVFRQTKAVLLEAAIFPSHLIRQTAKSLGLRTDASSRFERGVSSDLPDLALRRASSLLHTICQATVQKGDLVVQTTRKKSLVVTVSHRDVTQYIGVKISKHQITSFLTRLGFSVRTRGQIYHVTPPIFRLDVRTKEDVIEEVARLFGYDVIPETMPVMAMDASPIDPIVMSMSQIRQRLSALGYTETVHDTFYNEETATLATMPISAHRSLVNPVDGSKSLLRTDVLPLLFESLAYARKSHRRVYLFECGQVFWKQMKPGQHEWRLSMAVSCADGGELIGLQQDFVQLLISVFHLKPTEIYFASTGTTRDIKIGTDPVGYLRIRSLRHGMLAVGIECSMTELLQHRRMQQCMPISKFPTVTRDIAVAFGSSVDSFTILRQLHHASALVRHVELFDAHPLSNDTVSYAFHVQFSSAEKTLSASDIDYEIKVICRILQQKGGVIRS